MIPRTLAVKKAPSWQKQIQNAFRKPEHLLKWLEIEKQEWPELATTTTFPFLVPLSYAKRMNKGDINDPLLLQVLPLALEHEDHPDYYSDPVGDLKAMQDQGLIKKYSGRQLLITTAACSLHCRYCFRREFPYKNSYITIPWIKRIPQNPLLRDTEEMILSGGDPLMLTDSTLQFLFKQLYQLKELKRIRIHSRTATILPDRITTELLEMFQSSKLQIILVTHVNHAQELNETTENAIAQIRQTGVILFNQSVLLRHINDRVDVLQELSQKLFQQGVIPYYIHILDKVRGTAHFSTEIKKIQDIESELLGRLPGYLVPKFVTERQGARSKIYYDFN